MKVALGTLKDRGDELATFLEPRVGAKPSLAGDSIEIEDESVREGVRPRQVKTYIKRFLYMKGVREKYRVFVAGKELTIQEIEVGEEKEEEKKKGPEKKVEEVKAEPESPEVGATAPSKKEPAEEPKAAKPKKATPKKPRAKKKTEEED